MHRTANQPPVENCVRRDYTGTWTRIQPQRTEQSAHHLLKLLPRIAATVIFALTLTVLVACNFEDDRPNVTGQVTDVVPRSISEFESLTLVDDSGKTWEFKGGLFTGFTPSHLLEHAALKEPVRVWYTDENGVLTVTRIEDG
jgi:hypothetical protein